MWTIIYTFYGNIYNYDKKILKALCGYVNLFAYLNDSYTNLSFPTNILLYPYLYD
jgi:hypothetical protein